MNLQTYFFKTYLYRTRAFLAVSHQMTVVNKFRISFFLGAVELISCARTYFPPRDLILKNKIRFSNLFLTSTRYPGMSVI
jgi:hypothetical protein